MEQSLAQAVEQIAADNRSGAAQLAERAADILLRRAGSGEAASPDAFRNELLATGWSLIQAQPVVAPIINLVNTVLWKLEEHETPRGLRQAVDESTDTFKRQIQHHAMLVAEGSLALIDDGATIVTLSQSSTVQHALLHAQRAGRRFSVICAESQPNYEGREMAASLVEHGMAVRLLSDAAVVDEVPHAQLVLVGADLLSSSGLINKFGTRALAFAAHSAHVPLYSLCSSEKFLPPLYPVPTLRTWHTNLKAHKHSEGAYYDCTPLTNIAGIVTEQGILPTETIEAWLASTKLHPALASRSTPATLSA